MRCSQVSPLARIDSRKSLSNTHNYRVLLAIDKKTKLLLPLQSSTPSWLADNSRSVICNMHCLIFLLYRCFRPQTYVHSHKIRIREKLSKRKQQIFYIGRKFIKCLHSSLTHSVMHSHWYRYIQLMPPYPYLPSTHPHAPPPIRSQVSSTSSRNTTSASRWGCVVGSHAPCPLNHIPSKRVWTRWCPGLGPSPHMTPSFFGIHQAERIAKKIALTVTGTLRQFKTRSNAEIDTNISVCWLSCLHLWHTHALKKYAFSYACVMLGSAIVLMIF